MNTSNVVFKPVGLNRPFSVFILYLNANGPQQYKEIKGVGSGGDGGGETCHPSSYHSRYFNNVSWSGWTKNLAVKLIFIIIICYDDIYILL